MAHDVLLGQANLRDALDVPQDMQGIHEAAAHLIRQVDLGHVAGDHDLAADAHARQEHLHLLGRGVLGLVQDDEGVIQRAPAHIGERCDLDDLSQDAPDVPKRHQRQQRTRGGQHPRKVDQNSIRPGIIEQPR